MDANESFGQLSENGLSLRRVPRHIKFVDTADVVHCFRPEEFNIESGLPCHYVNTSIGCQAIVKIFNYLDYLICSLEIDTSFTGTMSVISFTIMLLFLYITALFILGLHFIMPNYLAVWKRLHIPEYEFGFTIMSISLTAPDWLIPMSLCNNYHEYGTLFLSEWVGKTFGCFCVGMILLSFREFTEKNPCRFVRNVVMVLFGNFYLRLILHLKMHSELKPPEHQYGFSIRWHGLFFMMVYCGNIFYHFYKLPARDVEEADMDVGSIGSDDYEFPPDNEKEEDNPMEIVMRTVNPFANVKNWSPCFLSMVAPLWILIACAVPVVDESRPMNGWCKYMVGTSFVMYPLYFITHRVSDLHFYVLLFTGVISCGVLCIITDAGRRPQNHDIFAVYGIIVGCSFYNAINGEVEVLVWQVLNYLDDWKSDAIIVMAFPIGYCVAEAAFCSVLIKANKPEMAYGYVMGITLFSAYMALPCAVLRLCYEEEKKMILTAHTESVHVYMEVIIIALLLAGSTTNFRFRRSHGILIIILYSLYYFYMGMALGWIIHPYGTQHTVSEHDSKIHNDWA